MILNRRSAGRAWHSALLALVSAGGLALAAAWPGEAGDVVDGSASPAPPVITQGRLASLLKRDHARLPGVLSIVLPPVDPAEKAMQAEADKSQPMRVGFGRPVPRPYQDDVQPFLGWIQENDGTATAAFTVTSPDAEAIRVALDPTGVGEGVELRFFSITVPGQVFGPFTARDMRREAKGFERPADAELYWSPVIEGESIGVELRVARPAVAAGVVLATPQVSHLAHSVMKTAKDLSDVGTSGSCNIDVRCRPVSDSVRASTVKIIFTENGASFLCTGTLINDKDPDSLIPFFLTANHCIGSQAAAATVNSYFHFERAVCGGASPTSVIQRAGGALLLATNPATDATFLQLNDEVISITGIRLAGWDSSPLPPASAVVGVHHPTGDLKKVSLGTNTGFAGSDLRVVWSQGTTEGGSSGSGLFDAADRVRGQLRGGDASCSTPTNPDFYGRFDLTFPSVSQWLEIGAAPLASGVPVRSTVQQARWKEYKIVVGPGQTLTVQLFDLNQDADVYVRRDSRPTLTQFACRSILGGNAPDTCALTDTGGGGVYYVAVRGFASGTTSFTLQATLAGTFVGGTSPIHRFYNELTAAHFYTISLDERNFVLATFPQFHYEGTAYAAFTSQLTGSSPVYRFYNELTGAHFYTVSATERDFVIGTYPQFHFEGIAYYAYLNAVSGSTPVYRFYNTLTGSHFYTVSSAERDHVLATYPEFHFEGVAYHVPSG